MGLCTDAGAATQANNTSVLAGGDFLLTNQTADVETECMKSQNVLVMMLQTDLLEIGGVHVAKGLSGHSMMSQDGQIVLSGQFAQQVDQLLLHAGLLQYDDSLRRAQFGSQMFLCVLPALYCTCMRRVRGLASNSLWYWIIQ